MEPYDESGDDPYEEESEEGKKRDIFKKIKKKIKRFSRKKRIIHITEEKKKEKLSDKIKKLPRKLKEKIIKIKNWIKKIPGILKIKIIDLSSWFKGIPEGLKIQIKIFPINFRMGTYSMGRRRKLFFKSSKKFIESKKKRVESFYKKRKKDIKTSAPLSGRYIKDIDVFETKIMIATEKPIDDWFEWKIKKMKKELPTEVLKKDERIKDLKEEILAGLLSKPLSETLLKCRELAELSRRKKDLKWIEKELFGYYQKKTHEDKTINVGDKKAFPDYRRIDVKLQTQILSSRGVKRDEIYILPLYCIKPVYWIEETLEDYTKSGTKNILIVSNLPKEFSKMKEFIKNDKIPLFINSRSLKKILNEVASRIHEFVTSIKIKSKKRK